MISEIGFLRISFQDQLRNHYLKHECCLSLSHNVLSSVRSQPLGSLWSGTGLIGTVWRAALVPWRMSAPLKSASPGLIGNEQGGPLCLLWHLTGRHRASGTHPASWLKHLDFFQVSRWLCPSLVPLPALLNLCGFTTGSDMLGWSLYFCACRQGLNNWRISDSDQKPQSKHKTRYCTLAGKSGRMFSVPSPTLHCRVMPFSVNETIWAPVTLRKSKLGHF